MCICVCILHFTNVKCCSAIWYFASACISDLNFCMILSLNSPDYLLLDVFKDQTVSRCHEDSKIRLKACSGWECWNLELNISDSFSGCTISFLMITFRMRSKINKVRYDMKFIIDRVKKKLFALHVQHYAPNYNNDASCQPSFKQQI